MCCTGLGQLLLQLLDPGVKLAGIHGQLDALFLGLGKLGPQLGILGHQLQEPHVDGHDHLVGGGL